MLLEVFNNDFRKLANHLKVMEDRMVLINPNFVQQESQQEMAESQDEDLIEKT